MKAIYYFLIYIASATAGAVLIYWIIRFNVGSGKYPDMTSQIGASAHFFYVYYSLYFFALGILPLLFLGRFSHIRAFHVTGIITSVLFLTLDAIWLFAIF